MINKLLLVLFCLTFFIKSYAQKIKVDTVITQIITFESENRKDAPNLNNVLKKNSVGVGMASWLCGYTPVYYERQIVGFLSIQAGVGITYRSFYNDLEQLIWQDGRKSDNYYSSSYGSYITDIDELYYSYKYRKSIPGVYLSLAPKFYPAANGIDGFTVYPMIEYKLYNYKNRLPTSYSYDAYDENDVQRSSNFIYEQNHCLDFSLNVGGHYQINSKVYIGWRTGAGVRQIWDNRLDIGYNSFNNNILYTTQKVSRLKPFFGFDVTLGGLF